MDKRMNKLEWETICVNTHRLKINSGYLYMHVGSMNNTICFVPDAPDSSATGVLKKASTDQHIYEGLCKRIAWDVLRELQNSQPNVSQDGELQNRIFELEAKYEHDSHSFNERVEKLETSVGDVSDMWDGVTQVVGKLKGFYDRVNERIERLENRNATNTKVGMSQFNELIQRIEKLESYAKTTAWPEHKDSLEALKKAQWYLDDFIAYEEGKI